MCRTFACLGRFALLTLTLTSVSVYAELTIQVVAPISGSTVGSMVYYEANAQNTACASGISAIRIYSAPFVTADTVWGNHIETFISLSPGTYNTVVQAWDNCGNVAKQAVAVSTLSTPGVSVFSPSTGAIKSPIHIAASAQGACTVTAMRIYTAPFVGPYTINSDRMDAFLNVPPGQHNMVAQAWDSCGNVYKQPFSVNITSGSDKYLFTANPDATLSEFPINQGRVTNPNSPGAPPKYAVGSPVWGVAADPGGDFVYAIANDNLTGFQIDKATGKLYPMPGSPFVPVSSASKLAAMDPAGHFLYVAYVTPSYLVNYSIDRSTGALTEAPGSFPIPYPATAASVTTTANGAFVYLTVVDGPAPEIFAFSVNPSSGQLTEVPGSPFTASGAQEVGHVTAGDKYLYVDGIVGGTGNTGVWGYQIASDGSLTEVSGSPFSAPNGGFHSLEDWAGRNLWTLACAGSCFSDFALDTFRINSTDGSLADATALSTGISQYTSIVQDHSGQYLYVGGEQCTGSSCVEPMPAPPGIVGSFGLDGSGTPATLSGPLATGDNYNPAGIAVSP